MSCEAFGEANVGDGATGSCVRVRSRHSVKRRIGDGWMVSEGREGGKEPLRTGTTMPTPNVCKDAATPGRERDGDIRKGIADHSSVPPRGDGSTSEEQGRQQGSFSIPAISVSGSHAGKDQRPTVIWMLPMLQSHPPNLSISLFLLTWLDLSIILGKLSAKTTTEQARSQALLMPILHHFLSSLGAKMI